MTEFNIPLEDFPYISTIFNFQIVTQHCRQAFDQLKEELPLFRIFSSDADQATRLEVHLLGKEDLIELIKYV